MKPTILLWGAWVIFELYCLRSMIRNISQISRLKEAMRIMEEMRPILNQIPYKDFQQIMAYLEDTPSKLALRLAREVLNDLSDVVKSR